MIAFIAWIPNRTICHVQRDGHLIEWDKSKILLVIKIKCKGKLHFMENDNQEINQTNITIHDFPSQHTSLIHDYYVFGTPFIDVIHVKEKLVWSAFYQCGIFWNIFESNDRGGEKWRHKTFMRWFWYPRVNELLTADGFIKW